MWITLLLLLLYVLLLWLVRHIDCEAHDMYVTQHFDRQEVTTMFHALNVILLRIYTITSLVVSVSYMSNFLNNYDILFRCMFFHFCFVSSVYLIWFHQTCTFV